MALTAHERQIAIEAARKYPKGFGDKYVAETTGRSIRDVFVTATELC